MKSIIFNTEMVKDILDGRKTQFRKVAKGNNFKIGYVPKTYNGLIKDHLGEFYFFEKNKKIKGWETTENFYDAFSLDELSKQIKEYKDFPINTSDILYVKETFANCLIDGAKTILFKADSHTELDGSELKEVPWKSSVHMTKDLARIFLKVTNVRVERLQDSIDYNIVNEGFGTNIKQGNMSYGSWQTESTKKIYDWWINLWNSTVKDGYKWEDNPYVFVYEFERIKGNLR